MSLAGVCVLLGVLCILAAIASVLLVQGGHVPSPPTPEVVAPKMKDPTPTVLVRFEDTHGQALGSMTIERKARRHQMIYRHRGKSHRAGVFIASHEDKGVWVYRRVGED